MKPEQIPAKLGKEDPYEIVICPCQFEAWEHYSEYMPMLYMGDAYKFLILYFTEKGHQMGINYHIYFPITSTFFRQLQVFGFKKIAIKILNFITYWEKERQREGLYDKT